MILQSSGSLNLLYGTTEIQEGRPNLNLSSSNKSISKLFVIETDTPPGKFFTSNIA